MFTETQIKQAHGKVKSGADFPAYIREIKTLGVTHYIAYVADGHTEYYGANNYQVTTAPKYDTLPIAAICHIEAFKADLKAHQQGLTDYPTFISMCAKFGIEKWVVSIKQGTCTYYDKTDNEVLTEQIPQ